MKAIDIIDEHIIIRETVGYKAIEGIELCDLPEIIQFLKIVYNYKKMNNLNKK